MKRLNHDEFIRLIGAEIERDGSQKAFAARANISEQYLTDILRNRRSPGPKLLTSLGFREVRLYEKDDKNEG